MKHVKLGFDIVVLERSFAGDGEPMVGKVLKVLGDSQINAFAFPHDPMAYEDPYHKGIYHADNVPTPAEGSVFVWRGLGEQWAIDEIAQLEKTSDKSLDEAVAAATPAPEVFPPDSLGAGLPVDGDKPNKVDAAAPLGGEVGSGSVSDAPAADPNAGSAPTADTGTSEAP